MGKEPLKIRAVGVTTRNVSDAPILPDLLEQIPPDQELATVTAPIGRLLRNHLSGSGRSL